MPEYRVYHDKYAQGYISVLKKNKKYKSYISAIMKPGGIRPVRKPMHLDGRVKAESLYSESSRMGTQIGIFLNSFE